MGFLQDRAEALGLDDLAAAIAAEGETETTEWVDAPAYVETVMSAGSDAEGSDQSPVGDPDSTPEEQT